MGIAIDTVAGSVANPGAAFTAVVAAGGDSFTVRAFQSPDYARLERIIRGGATSGGVRVRSPRLHDNVTGIKFVTSQTPSIMLLPRQFGQPLYPVDQLVVEVTGGAAETDAAALGIYYSNLGGVNARLHSWGDVAGNIAELKTITVAVATGAVGTWVDTAINATEDLLKADNDYAVLGFTVDVATMCVGLKGIDTGNLRICAAGTTDTSDTAEQFIQQGEREGTPHIPVINSNNKANTFVSTFHNGATQNVNVELILARLNNRLS